MGISAKGVLESKTRGTDGVGGGEGTSCRKSCHHKMKEGRFGKGCTVRGRAWCGVLGKKGFLSDKVEGREEVHKEGVQMEK